MTSAPKPSDAAQREARDTKFAFAGLSLAVLLSTLNTSIVNVAMPTLAEMFDAPTAMVQWTVIAFVLAITTLIVSVGRLADIVGRKRMLLAGIAVFTAAAGACATAPSIGWLIAFRFLQGSGAAVMMALAIALVGELTSKDKAGRVMGRLGSMSAIGTALGPALGGLLISSFGWQAIFLVNLPLGLGAFALLARGLAPERAAPAGKLAEFDMFGTVLLALTLAAYTLALTRGQGGFGFENAVLLVFAAVALLLFVQVQNTSASPLLRMELLRSVALRSGLAMSLLVGAVMMSTLVVGPFYLSQALAVNAGTMGAALSVGPFMAALVASPAGRLVDRVGTGRTIVIGLGGTLAGCLAVALLPAQCGIAGYVIPVAVMTAGYALFQTANNTAVMDRAAAEQRGLISGLLNLSRNLGLVTGASFLGGVFAWAAGSTIAPSPAVIAFATRLTFSAAAVFIGAALLLGLRGARTAARTAGAANASIEPTAQPAYIRIDKT